MAHILCKIPTRGRPDQFIKTFESFHLLESGKHKITYLISIDEDDRTMDNLAKQLRNEKYNSPNFIIVTAQRAGKIGSVNRDMNQAPDDWDIVMQPADDFIALVQGWDDRVVEELETTFEDLDGVVWFFDGHQPKIDTLCIMGRKYYERFGYLYYPEYRTFWADVEFTEVADRLDRLIYSPEVLFEHRHPDWIYSQGYDGRKAGYDQLYHENDKPEDREWDEKLFRERMKRNFDLES